jgi:hypothetical protein
MASPSPSAAGRDSPGTFSGLGSVPGGGGGGGGFAVQKPWLGVYVAFSSPLPATLLRAMITHVNTLLRVRGLDCSKGSDGVGNDNVNKTGP